MFIVKPAHFHCFCGLQKLNTLNLHLFLYLQNLRNHFSTVLIKTNWYTTNCKYQGCKGLTNIIVESGNKIYDSRDNCNAIIETGSNTLISGCKTTIIPHSVTSIGDYAFNSCSGLMNITIPKSVTSLGKGTFALCANLASVTIPNTVTSMGNAAFEGCSNLTDITIKNPIPFSISTMSYFSTSATLTVPNGSAKAYSDMGGFWGQFAAIKEEANVNISEENMWSTCVLAFDAELPEGVRAFISTGMDENSVLMEEVTTLEAYKPYVLYAQNGYEDTLTGVVDLTAYQETVTDGVLSGAIVKQEASSGYILQNQGQGSKFYNMNGQIFTIPAGKCWLSAFDAGASSVTMRFTGGVTGIEGVYMERPTGVEGADMLYDLEGRRVENPLPGRVYIKGGKKVMLKNREF
ncbi:MAG: leucine-rich repeat domain-containing protein [Bacteroidaceae bacterium]|nr:leucine-rich repeat domain-containing protein [Bacteroidaceae bacterium]